MTSSGIWFGQSCRKGSDKYYIGSEAKDWLFEVNAEDAALPGFNWKVVLLKTIKFGWNQFSYVSTATLSRSDLAIRTLFLSPIKHKKKLYCFEIPSWVWAEEYMGYYPYEENGEYSHHYMIHASLPFEGRSFIIRASIALSGEGIKFFWAEGRQVFNKDHYVLPFFNRDDGWGESVLILRDIASSGALQGILYKPRREGKSKVKHLCRAHMRKLGDKIVKVNAHYRGTVRQR